ncbi:NUDIX domain-containing protein, partial [Methylobacterium segetis]
MTIEPPAGQHPAPPDLPYRPCVGITLVNRAGLVFIGRRRKEGGPEHVSGDYSWQMPQGGVDPDEDPRAAAMRELYEETNVAQNSLHFLAEMPGW